MSLDAVVVENRRVNMGLRKEGDDTSAPKWRFVASAKLFGASLGSYLERPEELNVPLF